MPVNGPQADGNVEQRFLVSPDLQASVRKFDWWTIWSRDTHIRPGTVSLQWIPFLARRHSLHHRAATEPEQLLQRDYWEDYSERFCWHSPSSGDGSAWLRWIPWLSTAGRFRIGSISTEPQQNSPETWKIIFSNWPFDDFCLLVFQVNVNDWVTCYSSKSCFLFCTHLIDKWGVLLNLKLKAFSFFIQSWFPSYSEEGIQFILH